MAKIIFIDGDQYAELLFNEPDPTEYIIDKEFAQEAVLWHDQWVKTYRSKGWWHDFAGKLEDKTHPFLREYRALVLNQKIKIINVFKKLSSQVRHDDQQTHTSGSSLHNGEQRKTRAKRNKAANEDPQQELPESSAGNGE